MRHRRWFSKKNFFFFLSSVVAVNLFLCCFPYHNGISSLIKNQELSTVCNIPYFDPWDQSVKHHIKNVPLPLKCTHRQKDWTYLTQDGNLVFNATYLHHFANASCYYCCVSRGQNDHELVFGPNISISLESITKVNCEVPEVNCFGENETLLYSNIHSQIVPDENRLLELDKLLPVKERKKHHHVLMLIFDAASHLNFLRLCPKTVKILQEKYKANFFQGTTTLGDSSAKSALAFFAGKNYSRFSNDVFFKEYYDSWDFIWKQYARAGYLTLDDQDSSTNIFLYLKKGFQRQPTDHRQRVFWLGSDLLSISEHYSKPCLANTPKHVLQLEYLKQFLTRYSSDRPKFVMFWNTCLCHDYIENLAYADNDLAQFFTEYFHLLKDSYIFVMGDHGHKFSTIRNTVIGHFEAMMPFLSLSIPASLRSAHPEIQQNIERNSKHLVSHYDTYVTLRDILLSEQSGWGDTKTQKNWNTSLEIDVPGAQSFLRPLTPNRTCEQIGVPADMCICGLFKSIHTQGNLAFDVSRAVISKLNSVIKIESKCAQLTLQRTLSISELGGRVKNATKSKHVVYRVTLEADPSNGTFEAMVKFEPKVLGGNYLVDGTVLRTNRYYDQPHCVLKSNPAIRDYCYCLE